MIVDEPESEDAVRAWDAQTRRASSRLLYAETRAALARAERKSRLTTAAHATALANLETLLGELTTIEVDEALVELAGALAADEGLRGYDAIHLASALELLPEPVLMLTWDRELARAAHRRGCAVLPRLKR